MQHLKKIKFSTGKFPSNLFLAFVVFAVALGIYIITLCPTLALSDSGELGSVCHTLGIAHPTGYPLYTLLGNILTKLIYPPILATNFLSAIFAALAALFLYLAMREVRISRAIAVFAALLFPMGKILWDVAVVTEVYSLSSALQWAGIFLLFRWRRTAEPKYFLAFAYIFGLAFTNHMSAVLFLPAILLIILINWRKLSLKILLLSALGFAIAMSLYLYLPIRSAQNPLLNWGAPDTLARFWRHLSGWQYRVWMFTRSFPELIKSLHTMFAILGDNFSYIFLFSIAGFIGFIAMQRFPISGSKKIGYDVIGFLALVFLFDALYSMNYIIPDIAPYYLPVAGVMAFCTAGILGFLRKPKWLTPVILFIAVVAVLIANFQKSDRSDDWSAREYAENILSPIPAGSILILESWDMYAPSLYLQTSENIRPELKIFDFELFRRSWYVEQLIADKKFAYVHSECSRFLKLVEPFESGESYNSTVLQTTFENMISAIVEGWNGPVFAFTTKDFFKRRFSSIPEGLLRRIDSQMKYRRVPVELFEIDNTLARKPVWNERQRVIYNTYIWSFLMRGAFLYDKGKLDESEKYLQMALLFNPSDRNILENLVVVQIEQDKFDEALATVDELAPYLPPGGADMLRQDIMRRKTENEETIE